MEIAIFQVDAFAAKLFEGNPAAVCPLNTWIPDELMQSIAAENNLSETAFFVPQGEGKFHIRWFTPASEVDLCGHATLATAFVLFDISGYEKDTVEFESRSGKLFVKKVDNRFVLDFPAQPPVADNVPDEIINAFNIMPVECLRSEDYLVVFKNESDVVSVKPDYNRLKKLDLRGVIITAKSQEYDFVVRFFAPKLGVNEDPVTGSAYTQLAPYWASKTGKNKFVARQVSQRSGEVTCELDGNRVKISGSAVLYMHGTITIKVT